MRRTIITGLVALALTGCSGRHDEASSERARQVSEITNYMQQLNKSKHYILRNRSREAEVIVSSESVYCKYNGWLIVRCYPDGKMKVTRTYTGNKNEPEEEVKDEETLKKGKEISDDIIKYILESEMPAKK